ncbi:MAG TPA: glutamate--tRNA ligase [Candidatus Saccharimonas sp.]|nr:glutamate--tRNA ligase [Candidatus Saccharimonas sp.]
MSSHHSTAKPTPAVRVRFAPSPTGLLHIGGMRSALFNWLWARHTGGTFVLRLEDTDRNRLVEGSADQIYASHEALGITPDEGPQQGGPFGPYVQSERLDIYRAHADQLLATGALYRCWCSSERLDQLRAEAEKSGVAFKYDRHCLVPANQGQESDSHVLRFRIPDAPESIAWDDAVRGHISFKLADLDDFIAIKADGFPTYHFANIVDDHLMEISHVLRADEWLPSTPKHLLLWQAFDWPAPVYAHLPAVQGPTGGKKLSKRDGAEPVEAYTAQGYLPEAIRSFLASLGWNDGTTQEVYTTPELIAKFTLDRIQSSPARFDKDRLTWMNGYIIRQMAPEALLEHCEGFWPAAAKDTGVSYRLAVLKLVQDRLKFLAELPELTEFFFADPAPTEVHDWTPAVIATLESSNFSHDDLETRLRGLADEQGTKPGDLFKYIRLAVTGRTAAPGLFETLHVLGQDTVLRRLRAAK